MKLKNWTILFILLVIAAIAIFDVWVIVKGGTQVSISWTIWEWSAGDCSKQIDAKPLVPYIAGFVSGHLFWQMRKK